VRRGALFGYLLTVIGYLGGAEFRDDGTAPETPDRVKASLTRRREDDRSEVREWRSAIPKALHSELVVILMRANPSPKKRVSFDEMTYSAIMVADSYGPLPGFDRPKP